MKPKPPYCAECERLRNLLNATRTALDGIQADMSNAASDLGETCQYAKKILETVKEGLK